MSKTVKRSRGKRGGHGGGDMLIVTKRRGRKLNKTQKATVKKMIGRTQETKFFTSFTNAQAVTTAGVIFSLFDPIQGMTDSTRIGDRVRLTHFYLRGSWFYADTSNLVRLIIFQWKPSSVPVITNILLNGPTGVGNPDVYSNYSHDFRQQFTILYDKFHHLEGNGTALVGTSYPLTTSSQRTFVTTIRPQAKQLQFSGATTVGTNKIYYIAISDSSAVPNPFLYMDLKFMFKDG